MTGSAAAPENRGSGVVTMSVRCSKALAICTPARRTLLLHASALLTKSPAV